MTHQPAAPADTEQRRTRVHFPKYSGVQGAGTKATKQYCVHGKLCDVGSTYTREAVRKHKARLPPLISEHPARVCVLGMILPDIKGLEGTAFASVRPRPLADKEDSVIQDEVPPQEEHLP